MKRCSMTGRLRNAAVLGCLHVAGAPAGRGVCGEGWSLLAQTAGFEIWKES
jgi:hypothetical protein